MAQKDIDYEVAQDNMEQENNGGSGGSHSKDYDEESNLGINIFSVVIAILAIIAGIVVIMLI